MLSVDVSTRECDGPVVVALRGELDVADATSVAATCAAVAAHEREIIVDLAGVEFIELQRRGSAGACAEAGPGRRG